MIAITNMKSLPDYCYKCPCYDSDSDYCRADEKRRCSDCRPHWCPLKEIHQEPVKPKLVGESTWTCGKCDALLGWEDYAQSGVKLVEYKFCPKCGREVNWE